jgi:hypothetical protein
MTFLKNAILVLLCSLFFVPKAFASQSKADLKDSLDVGKADSSITTRATLKKKRTKEIPNYEFIIPSMVIHGLQPDSVAANNMPRKMVGNGDAVITPGIGLEYKGDEGLMVLSAVIKDCYNNLAGTMQAGEYFRINRDSIWGLTFGFYARETPIVCSGPNNTNCTVLDSYNIKFVTFVNGESVDVIPMPFLHYSYVLYKDKDFQINFKFMGNIALNEFGFDIPF